jgi:hypothetical protein
LRRNVPTGTNGTIVNTERFWVLFKPFNILAGLLATIPRFRKAADELVLVPLVQILEERYPLKREQHLPTIGNITVYSEAEFHFVALPAGKFLLVNFLSDLKCEACARRESSI